jgi:hypothetical protein
MTDAQLAAIASVLSRAPEWVRRDLSSATSTVRQRAEDALAAMLTAAIRETA